MILFSTSQQGINLPEWFGRERHHFQPRLVFSTQPRNKFDPCSTNYLLSYLLCKSVYFQLFNFHIYFMIKSLIKLRCTLMLVKRTCFSPCLLSFEYIFKLLDFDYLPMSFNSSCDISLQKNLIIYKMFIICTYGFYQ